MSPLSIPDAAATGALDAYAPDSAAADATPGADATVAKAAERLGYLLDETDPKACVRHVEDELWKAQDARLKPMVAQWDANEMVVDGFSGARVVYDPVTGQAMARKPNAETERVGPSKTEELIVKVTNTLLADPPAPEAEPSHDTDRERSAAELATQLLKTEMTEAGLHWEKRAESASILAGTHGSAFDVYTIDPQGGGWEPLQILAHPMATHYDEADPEAVLKDPMTGKPTEAYVNKYVGPGGVLQAGAVGAQPSWRIACVPRRVTGRQLRMLPQTATGIDDALGVVIAWPTTFGELAGRFPVIRSWSLEQQAKLVSARFGIDLNAIVPREVGIQGNGDVRIKTGPDQGKPADGAMCVVLQVFYRSHSAYPKGANVLVAGGEFVLDKRPLCEAIGEGDDAREECLLLPVAQCTAYSDAKGGNPYGRGEAQFTGAGDEVRQQVLAGIVERLWQQNNRNVVMDITTPDDMIQRWGLRDGSPILTQLAQGTPFEEQVPAVEEAQFRTYEIVGVEMESRFGLEAAAQGQAASNVTSGEQQKQVVEQALVMLTQRKRNLDAFLTRSWRIWLQLQRAYATTPQLLRVAGPYGGAKVREWRNTDLGGTKDVRIARGTGTMLTRSAKMGLAQNELNLEITADPTQAPAALARYHRKVSSNVDAMLGQEANPHRDRVRAQVRAWMEGPPAPPPAPAAPSGPLAQIAGAFGQDGQQAPTPPDMGIAA